MSIHVTWILLELCTYTLLDKIEKAINPNFFQSFWQSGLVRPRTRYELRLGRGLVTRSQISTQPKVSLQHSQSKLASSFTFACRSQSFWADSLIGSCGRRNHACYMLASYQERRSWQAFEATNVMYSGGRHNYSTMEESSF
jgi:hypothetical protein